MSQFSIYQINHYDPVRLGKNNRRIFIGYTMIAFLTMLLWNINIISFHGQNKVVIIILIIAFLIFIFLAVKLRYDRNKIKTIGEIEFTTGGIKKRIGDSQITYNYQVIDHIEIQKHIPSENKSVGGYYSYILKIIFSDSHSESLVVSGISKDPRQKLSIVETMKALSRIIKPEIRFNL